jgi:hypothetical protein
MYTNMKKLSSKGAQFVPNGMFVVCRKRNRQAQHMCCYSKSTTFWGISNLVEGLSQERLVL